MAQPDEQSFNLIDAQFIMSAPNVGELPEHTLPEYAFLGRSNVGKSSLLNMLFRQKRLARVSKTPGRTRLLNYFTASIRALPAKVDTKVGLVDLPGYGYAKVSQSEKGNLAEMLGGYLQDRSTLHGLFFLLDIRRDPSADDKEIFNLMLEHQVPLCIVLTKADKLAKSKVKLAAKKIADAMGGSLDTKYILTSADKGVGRQELLESMLN